MSKECVARCRIGAYGKTIMRFASSVSAARNVDQAVDELLEPGRFPRLEEDLLERFHTEHADEESTRWTAARWMYRMITATKLP